jgi:hypothetical protein
VNTNRKFWFYFCAGMIILATLLSACGSDSDQNKDQTKKEKAWVYYPPVPTKIIPTPEPLGLIVETITEAPANNSRVEVGPSPNGAIAVVTSRAFDGSQLNTVYVLSGNPQRPVTWDWSQVFKTTDPYSYITNGFARFGYGDNAYVVNDEGQIIHEDMESDWAEFNDELSEVTLTYNVNVVYSTAPVAEDMMADLPTEAEFLGEFGNGRYQFWVEAHQFTDYIITVADTMLLEGKKLVTWEIDNFDYPYDFSITNDWIVYSTEEGVSVLTPDFISIPVIKNKVLETAEKATPQPSCENRLVGAIFDNRRGGGDYYVFRYVEDFPYVNLGGPHANWQTVLSAIQNPDWTSQTTYDEELRSYISWGADFAPDQAVSWQKLVLNQQTYWFADGDFVDVCHPKHFASSAELLHGFIVGS